MPNWNEVLNEINALQQSFSPLDIVRRKYIKEISDVTGRNTIAYYSGFLQKPNIAQTAIEDDDKNAFMAVINRLDRSKGLDLILHTPGGDLAAAESIVDYLKRMFGNDVRAIIPQIAMSAGTMLACSCKCIIMGKQSNLGPIDPQFNGIPASGVLDEFEQAKKEIGEDPTTIPLWSTVIAKYHPSFIGECQNAIDWSKTIVKNWLLSNMFAESSQAGADAERVVAYFSDHRGTKSHSRHINIDECKGVGLKILDLETLDKEKDFQDKVLSAHHAYMHTFSNSTSIKIVENQNGEAMVRHMS